MTCGKLARCVPVTLFAALSTLAISAGTLDIPTDQELRSRAEAIVTGHVISNYSFYGDDGRPYTTWNIRVDEGIRGAFHEGDFARVTELGGIIDGKGLVVSSAPGFAPHENVLLFLTRRPLGGWSTLAGPFGKFSFRREPDGATWLIRNSMGAALVPRAEREKNVPRRADLFLEYLRTGIVPRTEAMLPSVIGAATPTAITPGDYMREVCFSECHWLRWATFDTGGTITMLTNGVQNGHPDSLAAVDRAMSAWNGDVGSTISYHRGGTTTAILEPFDELNTIVFNSTQYSGPATTHSYISGTHERFGQTFWTIVNVDLGVGSTLDVDAATFDEYLAWLLGSGLGFEYSNYAAGANEANSVMAQPVTGSFGASIGSFDRTALHAVYPSGIVLQPVIRSFTAYPPTIRNGDFAALLWSTENVNTLSIDNGIGTQPTSGSVYVSPTSDTTYTLTATGSGTKTASVTITVLNQPEVIVTGLPRSLVQDSGVGGATSSFTVQNIGGSSTTISLARSESFFSVSPTTFALAAGASRTVTITGAAVSSGSYRGSVSVSGTGVRPDTRVTVSMLVTTLPSGPTSCSAGAGRIDVKGAVGSNPTGTAQFTNTSAYTVEGILTSDVPWIIPQSGLITILPGQTVTVTFSIDRSLVPNGTDEVGSRSGTLRIVYRSATTAKSATSPRAGTTTLATGTLIVDTSTPPVQTASGIPPLGQGEVAYFVPGVGHALGGQGLYISDLSFTNLTSSALPNRVDLYYTPLGTGTSTPQTSKLDTIQAQQPIALADVVKNVFNQDSQIGTVQLRSSAINALSVNANILNVSNPDGTYGTTIPVLRSDRGVGPGGSTALVDIRTSDTYHTNVYIQETAGGTVNVTTTYYDAAGTSLGTRTDTAGPFQLVSVTDLGTARLPTGTVTMILKSSAGSTGQFSAYATPVDNFSADFWAVVDWNRQFGLSGSDPMVIPNVGSLHGANATFFRTDAAWFNSGTGQATGVAEYHYTDLTTGQKGVVSKNISISAKQSMILSDVATSLFALGNPSIGYIVFTPQAGTFNMTSRTYATVGDSTETFGTGVTTLASAGGERLGDVVRMGGVEDASIESVNDEVPGSFRSNGFLLESGGGSVTVRVTIYFPVVSTGLAQASGFASRDFTLSSGDLLQLGGLAGQIIGASRSALGDLHNMQVEFAVIGGDGALTPFITSVDNGTGDTILRTE